MNLQEQVNKIKSMMGVVNESKDLYDRARREVGFPDMPSSYEGGLDDPEDLKDDPDKWKTADDFEDDKTPIDLDARVDEFETRLKTKLANSDGDIIDITYFGRENMKVVSKSGNRYVAPADILNVIVMLDEENDEYFSFAIITNVFTKETWDNMIKKYLVMKPVNMKYHKNGETQQVGKYKMSKNYMFYDIIENYGRLRERVVGVLKGEKKMIDLAPSEPFVPKWVES